MSDTARAESWTGGPVRTRAIVGDASSRRFFREWAADGTTRVRCQYPEGTRAVLRRDVEVQRWLADRRVRVAELQGVNLDRLELLLEDFGEADGEEVLRRTPPADRWELARRLLRPLEILSRLPLAGLPGDDPRLDGSRLRWELAGFELWFVRHLVGRRPSAALGHWLDTLAEQVAAHPRRVCHRDYHLNNLFFLPGGEVGLVDAQDLLVGPDCYDAVSLVGERAFPELLPPDQVRRWLEAWAASTGAPAGWRERCSQVRLQRGLKVLGTFSRLTAAGRRGYVAWSVALAGRLAAVGSSLALPPELQDLLLHWHVHGGDDVR